MFDTDRDGEISRTELRAIFETGDQKDEALWQEIFDEVDTDGDGAISFDEFKESMTRVLKKTAHKKYLASEVNITEISMSRGNSTAINDYRD